MEYRADGGRNIQALIGLGHREPDLHATEPQRIFSGRVDPRARKLGTIQISVEGLNQRSVVTCDR